MRPRCLCKQNVAHLTDVGICFVCDECILSGALRGIIDEPDRPGIDCSTLDSITCRIPLTYRVDARLSRDSDTETP